MKFLDFLDAQPTKSAENPRNVDFEQMFCNFHEIAENARTSFQKCNFPDCSQLMTDFRGTGDTSLRKLLKTFIELSAGTADEFPAA